MISREEAVKIALDWDEGPEHSLNPFIVLTAFHSTGKVQSETHRSMMIELIEQRCMPRADAEFTYILEQFVEYVKAAPIEPHDTGLKLRLL